MSKLVYVAGVDGSEWSERAVGRAVNLAKTTGASVHLVAVVDWSAYSPMSIEELSQRPLDKKKEQEEALSRSVNPLVEKFGGEGVNITHSVQWGHPAEVIHKEAKEQHANMIFVGRRGRSRLADLILGSVANKLAHLAGVPIVLVP